MNRLAAIAALAVLVAGCSDPTAAPSSLRPLGPSFDVTPPPPPPFSGGGDATLTVTPDAALTVLGAASTIDVPPGPCRLGTPASTQIVFNAKFFENTQNSNSWLHIDILFPPGPAMPGGDQVTIHQPPNQMIDAHGMIVAPTFSFKITDATGGTLFGFRPEGGGAVFAGSFDVTATGIITDLDGTSCAGTGMLQGRFGGGDEVTGPEVIGPGE